MAITKETELEMYVYVCLMSTVQVNSGFQLQRLVFNIHLGSKPLDFLFCSFQCHNYHSNGGRKEKEEEYN